MIRRTSIKDIAKEVTVSPSTIRNWTDEGLIECKRDFRGWRWFENPVETIQKIQGMINGTIIPEKAVANSPSK